MRIALFGGSFDPPHRGHLAIAQAAIERLALDQVWMAPAGAQPLKPDGLATSYEDRLAMVELALAGDPHLAASAIDAPKSDESPNYTIDTLTAMKSKLRGSDRLFFLLGADAFLSLGQWHRARELPFACEFIVAGRPGFPIDDVPAALPAGISATRDNSLPYSAGLVAWTLHNQAAETSTVYLMSDLHEEVSATDIRAALAGDEAATGVLSPAVLSYIEANGLYR